MRLTFLLLFLFVPASSWAMGHFSEYSTDSPLIGQAAPDAVLTTTEGESASIIGSRQGRKAILFFWATWCPHCYEELGTINDNIPSIERKGIKVILIDLGEPKEQVEEYFLRRQMKLVSFLDEDNTLQELYHLIGVPTLVFIDGKGIIRSVTHAFPSDYENYFRAK